MNRYSKKSQDKFNREFEDKNINKPRLQCMDKKLEDMRSMTNEKSITDLTVIEILIGIKDTWFSITDDLIHMRLKKESFTKNNGLFYIGLTLVFIVMIMFLYEFLSQDNDNGNDDKNKNVVEIRHLYKLEKNENDPHRIIADTLRNLPALSTTRNQQLISESIIKN